MSDKKPIEEVAENLHKIVADVKAIKSDIHHIKDYIRKIEVRETLKRDNEKKEEEEYVKTGWWW